MLLKLFFLYGGSEEGRIENLWIFTNGGQWCKTPAAEFELKKDKTWKEESLWKLSVLRELIVMLEK